MHGVLRLQQLLDELHLIGSVSALSHEDRIRDVCSRYLEKVNGGGNASEPTAQSLIDAVKQQAEEFARLAIETALLSDDEAQKVTHSMGKAAENASTYFLNSAAYVIGPACNSTQNTALGDFEYEFQGYCTSVTSDIARSLRLFTERRLAPLARRLSIPQKIIDSALSATAITEFTNYPPTKEDAHSMKRTYGYAPKSPRDALVLQLFEALSKIRPYTRMLRDIAVADIFMTLNLPRIAEAVSDPKSEYAVPYK